MTWSPTTCPDVLVPGSKVYPAQIPQPLPITPRPDGRPVWEPPILDYLELIGEEYEKKREAVMKYTSDDVVWTTKLMDIYTEDQLLWKYFRWVDEEVRKAVEAGVETQHFLVSLKEDVLYDGEVVEDEWKGKGGMSFIRSLVDGKWIAVELFGSGKRSDQSSGSSHDGEMEANKLPSVSSEDTSSPEPPSSAVKVLVIPALTSILRRHSQPPASRPLAIRLLSASAAQPKSNLKTKATVAQQSIGSAETEN